MKALLAVAALGLALGAQAQRESYTIDPTHTFVYFEVVHLGTSTHRGRFDRKQGTVQLDRAARSGRVELSLETASVSTGVALLDEQLQGPAFFDAARYPNARFVGEQFDFDGPRLAQVGGFLTLREQTQPVLLKAVRFDCYLQPLLRREVCGGDFVATIQRSQWGLGGGLDAGVPDEVRLLVQVEAIKQ